MAGMEDDRQDPFGEFDDGGHDGAGDDLGPTESTWPDGDLGDGTGHLSAFERARLDELERERDLAAAREDLGRLVPASVDDDRSDRARRRGRSADAAMAFGLAAKTLSRGLHEPDAVADDEREGIAAAIERAVEMHVAKRNPDPFIAKFPCMVTGIKHTPKGTQIVVEIPYEHRAEVVRVMDELPMQVGATFVRLEG